MDKTSLGQIINKIRTYAGISQQELADYMNVSFATVNRWENNHAYPTKGAQDRLFDFCQEHQVPLSDYVMERMMASVEDVQQKTEGLFLYHGSKTGIECPIVPVSRKRCDFGPGFYMGTMPEQPLTLICDFPESVLYGVSLDLKGLNVVEISPDITWAMLVAFHRGKMDVVKGTALYKKYSQLLKDVDLVVGSIANDRMFQVLDDFFVGNITDVALIKSLSALQLGKQYVALTPKACKAISIEAEIKLSALERKCLQQLSDLNRRKGVALAQEICKANRREGKYFDEILEEAK